MLKELLVRVKRTEDDVRFLKKDRSHNSSSAEKKPAAIPLVVRVSLYLYHSHRHNNLCGCSLKQGKFTKH